MRFAKVFAPRKNVAEARFLDVGDVRPILFASLDFDAIFEFCWF